MYIFIKIYENESGKNNGQKPFIVESHDLKEALDKVCEKYYQIKFSSIMTVIHYPKFLHIMEIIRSI